MSLTQHLGTWYLTKDTYEDVSSENPDWVDVMLWIYSHELNKLANYFELNYDTCEWDVYFNAACVDGNRDLAEFFLQKLNVTDKTICLKKALNSLWVTYYIYKDNDARLNKLKDVVMMLIEHGVDKTGFVECNNQELREFLIEQGFKFNA